MWLLACACLLAAPCNPPQDDSQLLVGTAARIVTPQPPLPISGGMGPSNPSNQTAGDLTVRALVLTQGNTRVAIASTDFLGFPAVLGDKVRAKVEQIPAKNILIGATHTHSAPDPYGFPNQQGSTDASVPYLLYVCEQLSDAIREAARNAVPATLKAATGEPQGQIAYNSYAEALFDPRCHVLQFLDNQQRPLATLVNYAVHPEVLGSDRGITSPDLVGPLCDRIATQGGGFGIFMNSAQGGMVTADNRRPNGTEVATWEECQRIGNLLADEALRIVAQAPIQSNPRLQCFAREFVFPIDSKEMRAVLELSPLQYPQHPDGKAHTIVNLINLGNVQILTIPGEALPNIGFYLKRKMHGEHNLLFGLTNDAFGYILAKEDWQSCKRYNYISRVSLGENTGAIFVDGALNFLKDSPKPQSTKP